MAETEQTITMTTKTDTMNDDDTFWNGNNNVI